jgi:hypothetical protein
MRPAGHQLDIPDTVVSVATVHVETATASKANCRVAKNSARDLSIMRRSQRRCDVDTMVLSVETYGYALPQTKLSRWRMAQADTPSVHRNHEVWPCPR